MDTKWLSQFASPSAAFRGKPFWAWNGKLEEGELRRQVRLFHRMGLGGFFMHSRVGLDTEYLSEEWFRCVGACIDEAKKLDMEAWLYDEDRWPSGAAGGIVTKNPKYRARELVMEQHTDAAKFKWTPQTMAAFTAIVEGTTAREVTRLAKGVRPKLQAGQTIVAVLARTHECSDWYNGGTYLDTMSHEAVREFIKVTHEQYAKRFGKDFGKVVPGMFTDEPNYSGPSMWSPYPRLMWTPRLPQVFKQRYGYDLTPHLLELFFDVEGVQYSQARYHYFDCCTFLFVDAFSRQVGEWCAKHKLLYTGHVLMEDAHRDQISMVGSAMRHYEYMQAPGMDLLTEHWRVYQTAKQVSSAARQFGAKWRLTETYGCTGWDFSFEGHKALGDWQAAQGINLRCQHLSWYTMRGEAKRDYPAGIFYQSPWWEQYPTVEDYYARIGAAMTRGQEVRDLLVLHSVESTWMVWTHNALKDPKVLAPDAEFQRVTESLLHNQIDFDYGEEELLSRHARVAKVGGKAVLKVGKAQYTAVLAPPMITMRATTLELLRKFKAAGGMVVFAGDVAACVDGVASPAVAEFAALCPKAPAQGKELAAAVESCRRVSVTDGANNRLAETIYLLREDKDAFYLFVVNTGCVPENQMNDPMARDRKAEFPDVRIRGFAGCKGKPVELDPASGKAFAATAEPISAGWEIKTSLPRLGSRLFVVPKAKSMDVPKVPALRDVRSEAISADRWRIVLSEPNVLVLDRARCQIGKGALEGPMDIMLLDSKVRESMGVGVRGGGMVQPWAQVRSAKPRHTPVKLAYAFNIETRPSGQLDLAIEEPDRFVICLNGTKVCTANPSGCWTDKSMIRVPLDPSLLRLGANELTLEIDYDEYFSGLEIVYLLGNFGTKVAGTELTMTAAPNSLALGDWCGQGLDFYSGSVGYVQKANAKLDKGQRAIVRLGEFRGVAVRVLVDGKPAGVAAWPPYEVDITDLLTGESAELTIEVLGHRRNSHGPLHNKEKWPWWTGPEAFTMDLIDAYNLVPCGLMTAPSLVIRQ